MDLEGGLELAPKYFGALQQHWGKMYLITLSHRCTKHRFSGISFRPAKQPQAAKENESKVQDNAGTRNHTSSLNLNETACGIALMGDVFQRQISTIMILLHVS